MLIEDLYTYRVTSQGDREIIAVIQVNSGSRVYRGHFPGLAITPGVCQVLMIKEILQDILGMELQLSEARYIKFSTIHEPGRDPEIEAHISYDQREDRTFGVMGVLQKEENRFLKFKGEFKPIT